MSRAYNDLCQIKKGSEGRRDFSSDGSGRIRIPGPQEGIAGGMRSIVGRGRMGLDTESHPLFLHPWCACFL